MRAARTIRSARRAAAIVLLLPIVGCDSPLSPTDLAGTYVLQRIAANPLPAELYRNEDVAVRVIADTIRLRADGTASTAGATELEWLRDGAASREQSSSESAAHFRIVDGRIEITWICPINANCAEGPHLIARRDGDGLRVEHVLGANGPLFYTRIADMR